MRTFAKQNFIPISIILIMSILSIVPMLHKGFFVTDDGEWMIIRLSSFYQTLRDGQFPVRFLGRLNFGYGYPVATFLYPGIMYFGSFIHLFKIGFVASIKFILGFSLVGSAVFMYLWLSKHFDKVSSVVGSIFYLYLPYHIYDVYTRGSVGEVFALLWVPFILWNLERRSIFFSALGITLLILSHNTLSLLFLPIIFIYLLISIFEKGKNRKYFVCTIILSLLLGIGASSFFLVPAIAELPLTVFSKTKVSNPLNYFSGFNLIGWGTVLIILLSLVVILSKRKNAEKRSSSLLFFLCGVISLFLSSSYSSAIWHIIPASLIQFPFRFLSILLLSASFLAALVISNLDGVLKKVFIAVSLAILAASTYQQIIVVNYFDKGENFYTTNAATTTIQDEYMPIWVQEKPVTNANKKVEIVNGNGEIKNIFYNNKKISFNTNLKNNSSIQISTIYWPGWTALVDGKLSKISYDNKMGLISINAKPGNHFVQVNFKETNLALFADFISILSFLILIYIRGRKYKHEST